MSHETGNIKTTTPKFRYGLKAEIVKAGHRTLSDFAQRAKINLPRLSRIVSGWELPGPGLQRKMAETLGITLSDLKELLRR